MVLELEDEFDLQIPDSEAEQLHTVGRVIDYVVSRKGLQPESTGSCASARMFYRLCQCMLTNFGHLNRNHIRRSTSIRNLFSRRQRRELFIHLQRSFQTTGPIPSSCRYLGDVTTHLLLQSQSNADQAAGRLQDIRWRVRGIIAEITGQEIKNVRYPMHLAHDIGMD